MLIFDFVWPVVMLSVCCGGDDDDFDNHDDMGWSYFGYMFIY